MNPTPRIHPSRRVKICLTAGAAAALACGAALAEDPAAPPRPAGGAVFFREPDRETAKRIQDLISQATSDSWKSRRRARGELESLGYWAVEPLIQAAQQREPPIKCASILTLDAIGDRRAIEPLREIVVREDSSQFIGAFAALALGRFRDSAVLKEPKDPFRKALDNPRNLDMLRAAVPLALARMQTTDGLALRLLREQLAEAGANEPVNAARLLALGFFPEAAVDATGERPSAPLEAVMKSGRQGERQAAVLAFLVANSRTSRGRDWVARVLESQPSPRVQTAALIGLASFDGTDVTERIARTMGASGPDNAVRELACDLLVERADLAALEPLLHALHSQQSTRLRASAVLALGRLDAAEAREAVTLALKDRTPLVRASAAVAAARSSSAQLRADALARIDARLQGGETDPRARDVLETARAVLSGERRDVVWPEVGSDQLFLSVLQTPRQRLIRAVNRRAELSLDLGKITDLQTEQDMTPDDLSGLAPTVDLNDNSLGGAQGGEDGSTPPPTTNTTPPVTTIGPVGSSRTSAWQELRDLKVELRWRPYFTLDDLPTPAAAATAPGGK